MKRLLPTEAWTLLQQRQADAATAPVLFVDIRMEIESLYVGRPPGVVHVPWYEYPDCTPDPAAFAAAVAREAGSPARSVLLLCRSGQRSTDAGRALEQAGFGDVMDVLHGFEGELNDNFQRSRVNGWRFDGLPWEQI